MLLCQFITLFWELKGGGGPFFWKWIPWPDLLEFHFWAIYVFMPKVTKANRILDPDPISMGIPSSVSIWNRSYRSYTGLLSGRVMQKIATLGTGKWLNGTSRMHCQLLAGLADRRSELYSFCFPRGCVWNACAREMNIHFYLSDWKMKIQIPWLWIPLA